MRPEAKGCRAAELQLPLLACRPNGATPTPNLTLTPCAPQTSSSEPLLVGETDVVALQGAMPAHRRASPPLFIARLRTVAGAATFKLRITSLSSHRDKQRFRIQACSRALLSRCFALTPARVVSPRPTLATRCRPTADHRCRPRIWMWYSWSHCCAL